MNDLATVGTSLALSGDYSLDLDIGVRIKEAAESLQFLLGDWVNTMQDRYGDTQLGLARDLSAKTGVATNTLREYARVSRTFDSASRLAGASWSHHQAATEAESPQSALQEALTEGLSVRDTKRLAKGLPLGGEDTAQKESSIAVAGASLEEAVLESIALAEQHLARALDTMSRAGFRLTVNVAQDIEGRLASVSKPFLAIEALIQDEAGAYVR